MFQTLVVEKIKTYFVFNNSFSESRGVYGMTKRRIGCACWKIMATKTHYEYVTPPAFPQLWLRERASMSGFTYTARLSYSFVPNRLKALMPLAE
jgi:hypothetical protein